MGRPLAPRQGAALSAFVVVFAFPRRREGVAGGNVPQRRVAEDAQRLKTGRASSLFIKGLCVLRRRSALIKVCSPTS